MDILKKTIELFCEILGVSEDEIDKTTEFTETFGVELIDLSKLVILLEKTFQVTIHDEYVLCFKNVGELASYVEAALLDY